MRTRASMTAVAALIALLPVGGCGGREGGDRAARAERSAKRIPSGTQWADWNEGVERARSEGRYVIVDVYTDWCGWCKRMDAEVYARDDVGGYLADKFVSIKLNAESDEPLTHLGHTMPASDLARAFGVTGYPTTLILSPDGSLLTSLSGYLPHERFLLVLRYLGDGHHDRGVTFEDYAAQAGQG